MSMEKRMRMSLAGVLFTLLASTALGCSMKPTESDEGRIKVRPAAKAGSWYEKDPVKLRKRIEELFDAAGVNEPDASVRAVICPHAGYAYSGPTAGKAYARLKGADFERVIVLAPSHHAAFGGGSIADVTHYETPLGRIPLDRKACDALLAGPLFTTHPKAHKQEHSLELQLPFLQCALSEGFTLIPVVISHLDADQVKTMADALLPLWDEKTLVVASSDFTHYGSPFRYVPFDKDIPKNLKKLDLGAMDWIQALNAEGFSRYVSETGATICGRVPIAVLVTLAKARGGMEVKLLEYTTSGAITGDYGTSVSYAAIAFTKPRTKSADPGHVNSGGDSGGTETDEDEDLLTEAECRTLLKLSRHTLNHYLTTGRRPDKLDGFEITERLKENRGVFVTLKKDGRLRGCIGYLQGMKPLFEAVMDNTLSAAVKDPRFPPVKADEEPKLHIDISVLTPVRRVKDIDEIEVGRDGLIISRGFRRGTLLPQVPVEYGWDRKTFLEHTCTKAGLPKDAYQKSDTKIERYGAQVFGETK